MHYILENTVHILQFHTSGICKRCNALY